ncbi:iron chelate uptake ABC transporter family permease subunit, partial [Staphylococcus epidermidis]|uniref:iron chelate uptake ABC transporter family permease subunit n=1 Tax=Staphylococcus epidermidis TaxID=1282 RepID=UPI00119E6F08
LPTPQAINLPVSYHNITPMFLIFLPLLLSISTPLIAPLTFLPLLTLNLPHQFINTYQHKFILPPTILFSSITLFIPQSLLQNLFQPTTQFTFILHLLPATYFIYFLLKTKNPNSFKFQIYIKPYTINLF